MTANKEKITTLKDKINAAMKATVLQTIEDGDDLTIARYSSGSFPLDRVLGKGSNGYGFPVGRIVEIYGPEASGKTTVVLSTIAAVQRAGGVAAIIDAEHALNLEYAMTLGVDIDELLICNPSNAEEAFDVVQALAESGVVQLIVVDSIAALAPLHVAESGYEQKHMDSGAKLNSTFMKKIADPLKRNDCTLILINQIREKIGVMFGNPETTPGGRAIKFAASVRLEVRRGEVLKKDGNDYGHVVKCKTVKNKTSPPNQVAEFRLTWGVGFDNEHALIDLGLKAGVLRKSGAWLYHDVTEQKWQGEDKMLTFLRANPEFSNRLGEEVLANGQ